jgi:hypothetical protein
VVSNLENLDIFVKKMDDETRLSAAGLIKNGLRKLSKFVINGGVV